MHVCETLLLRAFTTMPMYLMGFAESALYAYIFFVYLLSVFVHSNVRFSFGFLQYMVTGGNSGIHSAATHRMNPQCHPICPQARESGYWTWSTTSVLMEKDAGGQSLHDATTEACKDISASDHISKAAYAEAWLQLFRCRFIDIKAETVWLYM